MFEPTSASAPVLQTLVIYALGVVLQDSDTWNAPYR